MVAMNTIDAAVARMLSDFEDLFIILILLGLVRVAEQYSDVDKRGKSLVRKSHRITYPSLSDCLI